MTLCTPPLLALLPVVLVVNQTHVKQPGEMSSQFGLGVVQHVHGSSEGFTRFPLSETKISHQCHVTHQNRWQMISKFILRNFSEAPPPSTLPACSFGSQCLPTVVVPRAQLSAMHHLLLLGRSGAPNSRSLSQGLDHNRQNAGAGFRTMKVGDSVFNAFLCPSAASPHQESLVSSRNMCAWPWPGGQRRGLEKNLSSKKTKPKPKVVYFRTSCQ